MIDEKLKRLQSIIQQEVNLAWKIKMQDSPLDPSPKSFGSNLELLLNRRSSDISIILDEIAREQLKEQQTYGDPPDFSRYIRYSGSVLSHKEVFVGDKWVSVPNESCVDFEVSSLSGRRAFTVTISYKDNYATFTSTETLESFLEKEKLLQGEKLYIKQQNDFVTEEERDWMYYSSLAYNCTSNNLNALDNVVELYNTVPREFRRKYTYEISKISKKLGKPAKAGKIFHGTEKFMTKAGKIAKVGPYLSFGTMAYESLSNTWDAHTVVDGALLIVGIAAAHFGAPIVLVGIAVYGILDYAFGISEGIDEHFGRQSDIWNKKPIYHYPIQRTPLFNEVKIDNTYVAPRHIQP